MFSVLAHRSAAIPIFYSRLSIRHMLVWKMCLLDLSGRFRGTDVHVIASDSQGSFGDILYLLYLHIYGLQ